MRTARPFSNSVSATVSAAAGGNVSFEAVHPLRECCVVKLAMRDVGWQLMAYMLLKLVDWYVCYEELHWWWNIGTLNTIRNEWPFLLY